ncbi:unnamed protein product [Miscanthus lutarioriparius]|uniref:Uncharacterized protein n=1 Tax=Miscanthus lutarioriparius TaxID=422564 RepID=A0A811P6G6_9POAL|nr:unnamed protein product [Miscanthus lutarioriparius]
MAKIQPRPLPAAAASPPSCSPSGDEERRNLQKQAVYMVWMKSLVFNGNGCTVYGADGGVAFRVDNYGCRGGREVFLMDCAGRTLVGIRRRSCFGMFRRWEACRYSESESDGGEETRTAWFAVRKAPGGGAAVTMHGSGRTYAIVGGCSRKPDYRIIGGADGAAVAAVARKQTPAGVVLGDDVLTLTVAPGMDHLLVLGLVVVCGLMNRCL